MRYTGFASADNLNKSDKNSWWRRQYRSLRDEYRWNPVVFILSVAVIIVGFSVAILIFASLLRSVWVPIVYPGCSMESVAKRSIVPINTNAEFTLSKKGWRRLEVMPDGKNVVMVTWQQEKVCK